MLSRARDRARAAEAEPVVSLGAALAERMAAPVDNGLGVAERLVRKFGYGQAPAKRRELYRRLEALAALKGDEVLEVISEAVAEAVGARMPDRYFCRAVVVKLREHGYGLGAKPGGDTSW